MFQIDPYLAAGSISGIIIILQIVVIILSIKHFKSIRTFMEEIRKEQISGYKEILESNKQTQKKTVAKKTTTQKKSPIKK